MLVGALGCNLAWGLIDAVFYLMGNFSVLGQGILKVRALRQVASPVRGAPDHCRRIASRTGVCLVFSRS